MLRIHASLGLVLLTTVGCSFGGWDLGLSGDSSEGELGRTRWGILDGLCPGLGGSCGTEVRVAEGATLEVSIDGVNGAPLTARTSGSVVAVGPVRVSTEGDSPSRVTVRAVTQGEGVVEVSDASGTVDRSRFTVARATGLECGAWPTGSGWRMEGLVVGSMARITATTEGASPENQVACRAFDSRGPLLAVDTVHWRRLSGEATVTPGGFIPAAAEADGARMYMRSSAPGTSEFEVTIGDVSRRLTVVAE